MNLARLASRVAVGGVAAALATAGLVGVTSTSASAVPKTTTYSCTPSLGSPFSADVVVDIALLPSTAPAGFPVPAGLLSFNSSFTVDNAVATGLGSLGVTGGKSDDFAAAFGTTLAKAPVVWNTATPGATRTTFSGKGANGAFLLPAAGTYTVAMPKQFTLQGTNASGQPVAGATATCTSAAPTALGSITLSKQASVTKVKAVKKIKHGAVESVKIKVTNDYSKTGGVVPTGKVSIKDGSKTIGKGKLKNGKVTIKVKSLSVGTHNLVVKYAGDKFTNKSKSKKLKVTVTK
jgi:hypothetical protein